MAVLKAGLTSQLKGDIKAVTKVEVQPNQLLPRRVLLQWILGQLALVVVAHLALLVRQMILADHQTSQSSNSQYTT